jgi:hypothetical protein
MYSTFVAWWWPNDTHCKNKYETEYQNTSKLQYEIITTTKKLKKVYMSPRPTTFNSRNPIIQELHKNKRFCHLKTICL